MNSTLTLRAVHPSPLKIEEPHQEEEEHQQQQQEEQEHSRETANSTSQTNTTPNNNNKSPKIMVKQSYEHQREERDAYASSSSSFSPAATSSSVSASTTPPNQLGHLGGDSYSSQYYHHNQQSQQQHHHDHHQQTVLYSAIGSLENNSLGNMGSFRSRILHAQQAKQQKQPKNVRGNGMLQPQQILHDNFGGRAGASSNRPTGNSSLSSNNKNNSILLGAVTSTTTGTTSNGNYTNQPLLQQQQSLPLLTTSTDITTTSTTSSLSNQQPQKPVVSALALAEKQQQLLLQQQEQMKKYPSPVAEEEQQQQQQGGGEQQQQVVEKKKKKKNTSPNGPELVVDEEGDCSNGGGVPTDSRITPQTRNRKSISDTDAITQMQQQDHPSEQTESKQKQQREGQSTGRRSSSSRRGSTGTTTKKKSKKRVTIDPHVAQPPPPPVMEMFRPSCDAYTPRIEKKKIGPFKPPRQRVPAPSSDSMGTLSRPNFRDALRRVAMILHQHITKIERRFETNNTNDNSSQTSATRSAAAAAGMRSSSSVTSARGTTTRTSARTAATLNRGGRMKGHGRTPSISSIQSSSTAPGPIRLRPADNTNEELFKRSMKVIFSEDAFVTPRYNVTMAHVPMVRPGFVLGMKHIQPQYEIPTGEEIYEFAHSLFKKVQLSSECSIVCLIYVERLMETAKVPLLASTWKPIFMCGLLLASKVWQDLSSWNIEFASVYPQFSLESINRLEHLFLQHIKWDLYISSSLYAKYYFALRSLLEKKDFRQRYNRMVGGVDNVAASEALKIQQRTEVVKEEALLQLSRSM